LQALQTDILHAASVLVGADGRLAYATCSVLAEENIAPITSFLAASDGWRLEERRHWVPNALGDGFSIAILARV
jgi:16S rRNA (cytosine967-C5)-methyltransferase